MFVQCLFKTIGTLGLLLVTLHGAEVDAARNVYADWPNGMSADTDFFPIAVWLQSPRNAERYKEAGINLYVGLWRGPNEEQLAQLERVGMRVICAQNRYALSRLDNEIIAGWMHGDSGWWSLLRFVRVSEAAKSLALQSLGSACQM